LCDEVIITLLGSVAIFKYLHRSCLTIVAPSCGVNFSCAIHVRKDHSLQDCFEAKLVTMRERVQVAAALFLAAGQQMQ
jgi:hypothetical protein